MFSRPDRFEDVRDPSPRADAHPGRSSEQSSSPMRIGKTVILKGELSAAEDMVIFGRLDGTITVTDHTLTIGKNAAIEAEIKAHTVVVEGRVTGNVDAAEQLEICPDGVILGDVRAPSLVIRDGATFKGRVEMDTTRSSPKSQPAAK